MKPKRKMVIPGLQGEKIIDQFTIYDYSSSSEDYDDNVDAIATTNVVENVCVGSKSGTSTSVAVETFSAKSSVGGSILPSFEFGYCDTERSMSLVNRNIIKESGLAVGRVNIGAASSASGNDVAMSFLSDQSKKDMSNNTPEAIQPPRKRIIPDKGEIITYICVALT